MLDDYIILYADSTELGIGEVAEVMTLRVNEKLPEYRVHGGVSTVADKGYIGMCQVMISRYKAKELLA